MYILTIFISFSLFLPVDILTDSNYIATHLGQYLVINISILSITSFLYIIIINLFNNKFWSKRMFYRFFLEMLSAIIIMNILLFIAQNILGVKENITEFLSYIIEDKSIWTSALESIFIMLLIETINSYNKHKENELEREKFKYNQLKNQLNPHFLFNSLNILSAMIYTKTPGESVDFIEKLSDFYRYALTNEDKNLISLNEEIKIINKYGDILKIRFADGFLLKIDLKEEDLDRRVLFMSLQLLVENAVKHNIASKEKPLVINIYSENNFIVVSNNIIIRSDNVISTGIGLDNLNERYKIIANKEITIIEEKEKFTVKIPMI